VSSQAVEGVLIVDLTIMVIDNEKHMKVTRRQALVGMAVSAIRTAPAAKDRMAKIDLFQAGEEGYEVYRLPGMVVTPKDAVLAFCEARKSRRGDWGTIDILEDADIKEFGSPSATLQEKKIVSHPRDGCNRARQNFWAVRNY